MNLAAGRAIEKLSVALTVARVLLLLVHHSCKARDLVWIDLTGGDSRLVPSFTQACRKCGRERVNGRSR